MVDNQNCIYWIKYRINVKNNNIYRALLEFQVFIPKTSYKNV